MNNVSIKGAKITACCIEQIPFAWYVKHTSKMTAFDIANKKGEVCGLALGYQADQSSDVSAFLRRCLRLISPLAAATRNPAVLSPVSLSCSISSMTSWGIRTVVICDLAFFAPVAITETPLSRCISVYAIKLAKKTLRCISLRVIFNLLGDIHLVRAKPAGATNTNGPLTSNVNGDNAMAVPQCTQTHPKFTWRFLALGLSTREILSVDASTEREARDLTPSCCVIIFMARTRLVEVNHACN